MKHRIDQKMDQYVSAIIHAYYESGSKVIVDPIMEDTFGMRLCRPGYGLYDRALGIMYLWGAWDALKNKQSVRKEAKEEATW
ncbi:hypothetical protein BSAF29S_05433 [Bacillus safensis subsp. safensis]